MARSSGVVEIRTFTPMKKLQAIMLCAWIPQKRRPPLIAQRSTGRAGGNFGMYFRMARGDTWRASFSSSSLAIRSSPHEGLSRAIFQMSRWSSTWIGRRPPSDFQRQKWRKPLRCQATKVLGLTKVRASRQLKQRLSSTSVRRVGLSARRALTLRS